MLNLVPPSTTSNAIISVFSRLDELHHNITQKQKLVGDSEMMGIDELFIWLDAVAARTTDGPVLLVFTHADKVSDAKAHELISRTIQQRLNDQEHPVRARLQSPPGSTLMFFVVDNTKGLDDPGVNAYRETVKKLAEASPTALQKVPVKLLKLQDAIVGLSREATSKDTAVMKKIRAKYPADKALHRLDLADYTALFEEATGIATTNNTHHSTLRTYLDFFNMLGVVTHSNIPVLEDLIIINPLWLLKQITMIIRRPSLHPLPIDRTLPGEPMRMLYEKGVLESKMMKLLWQQHEEKLQVELLNLCLQASVCDFVRGVFFRLTAPSPTHRVGCLCRWQRTATRSVTWCPRCCRTKCGRRAVHLQTFRQSSCIWPFTRATG